MGGMNIPNSLLPYKAMPSHRLGLCISGASAAVFLVLQVTQPVEPWHCGKLKGLCFVGVTWRFMGT